MVKIFENLDFKLNLQLHIHIFFTLHIFFMCLPLWNSYAITIDIMSILSGQGLSIATSNSTNVEHF